MIRINLLPVRALRVRQRAQKQVGVYALAVAVLIVFMVLVYLNGNSALTDLNKKIKTLEAKESSLKKIRTEVTKLDEQKELLQEKLKIIADLERQRKGPVRVLDELSMVVPAEEAWLTRIRQAGSNLTLEGIALNNETVSKFMIDMEKSDLFSGVAGRTRQQIINDRRLMYFSITCQVNLEKAQEPEPEDKPVEKENG